MTATEIAYPPGALVRARGREWVVLPSDDPAILRLRPLGGTDDDACGLYLPLEGDDVTSASLPLPEPEFAGNAVSAALLRDAVRLGLRSAAGPLRSIARIAVEPRPYQLVPLLMALRQQPVRLLIGDDVGVGKTVEAATIARELLDRGEIQGLCVLCPPHLCEQWRRELTLKFHLPAVEVRPGTATALERDLPTDRSIFQEHPFTVVSIDFIKSDRRRARFLQTCPSFVIVDEAHAAAQAAGGGAAQQQRHSLLRDLAADANRHLVLVTATPHSGDEEAFASLVGLLVPELRDRIAQLDYGAGTRARETLARHFVQRRRGDLDRYLQSVTVFPDRQKLEPDPTYRLTDAYQRLLRATHAYTQELVRSGEGLSQFHQRVRWWAALALLRCVSSSPAAAAAALRTRADRADSLDVQEADRLGQDAVFDVLTRDEAEGDDATPGADTTEDTGAPGPERQRLLALARDAEALMGDADPKLQVAERVVRDLLRDGFAPIVFCRYIATAHYVGEQFARRLKNVQVAVVTGELPAEERAARVADFDPSESRVLVATDCLSEGINLQDHFDAVVHYDLAWNPTRHEQREGRVDRYGQNSPVVRTALLYGQDNQIDGVVLRVLLRKAEQIRRNLGVSVPVPVDTNAVLEAIFEALFLRPNAPAEQLSLFFDQEEERVNRAWQAAADREERTRTVFAQHGLRAEEVLPELQAAAGAVGTSADVARFIAEAAARLGAPLLPDTPTGRMTSSPRASGAPTPPAMPPIQPALLPGDSAADTRANVPALARLDVATLPGAVRARADVPDNAKPLRLGFTLPVPDGVTHLARTHPLVEAFASYVIDTAYDDPSTAIARRCAAIRTSAVTERTILLVVRARFLIEEVRAHDTFPMLAEECLLAAFDGDFARPRWLPDPAVEVLNRAEPTAPVQPGQGQHWIAQALDARSAWWPYLATLAVRRADELLAAHRRVRDVAHLRGVRYRVQPHPDLDLLGLYILMPGGRPA